MPKRKSPRGGGAGVVRKQTRSNPGIASVDKTENELSPQDVTVDSETKSKSQPEIIPDEQDAVKTCESEEKAEECGDETETVLDNFGAGDLSSKEDKRDTVENAMDQSGDMTDFILISEVKSCNKENQMEECVDEKDQIDVAKTEEIPATNDAEENKEKSLNDVEREDKKDSVVCDEIVSNEPVKTGDDPAVPKIEIDSAHGKEAMEKETLQMDTTTESMKNLDNINADAEPILNNTDIEAEPNLDNAESDPERILDNFELNTVTAGSFGQDSQSEPGEPAEENKGLDDDETVNTISIDEDEFEAISVQDNLDDAEDDTMANEDVQYVDEEAEEEQNLLDVLSDDQEILSEVGKCDEKTKQTLNSSKFEEISEGSINQADQEDVLNDSFSDVEIIGETFAQDLKKQGRDLREKAAESLEEVFFATENDHSKVTAEDKDNDDISDDSLSNHDTANMSLEEISDDDVDVSKKRKSLELSKTATSASEEKPKSVEGPSVTSNEENSKLKLNEAQEKSMENVSEAKQVEDKSTKQTSPNSETVSTENISSKEASPSSVSKEKETNTAAPFKIVNKGENRKSESPSQVSKNPKKTATNTASSNSKSQKPRSDLGQRKLGTKTAMCQTAPREMKGKIIQCTINPIKAGAVQEKTKSKAPSKFLDQFRDKLPFSIPKDVIAEITRPQTCEDGCYSLSLGPISFTDMGSIEFRDNLMKKCDQFHISFDEQHHGIYRAMFKQQAKVAAFMRQLKGSELGNRFLTISLSYGAENSSNGVVNLMFDQDIQSRKQGLAKGNVKLRAKVKLANVPTGVSKDFIHLLFPEALSIASGPMFDNKRSLFLGFSITAQVQELLLCHDLVVINGHHVTLSASDYTERSTPDNAQVGSVKSRPVEIDTATEESSGEVLESKTAGDCATPNIIVSDVGQSSEENKEESMDMEKMEYTSIVTEATSKVHADITVSSDGGGDAEVEASQQVSQTSAPGDGAQPSTISSLSSTKASEPDVQEVSDKMSSSEELTKLVQSSKDSIEGVQQAESCQESIGEKVESVAAEPVRQEPKGNPNGQSNGRLIENKEMIVPGASLPADQPTEDSEMTEEVSNDSDPVPTEPNCEPKAVDEPPGPVSLESKAETPTDIIETGETVTASSASTGVKAPASDLIKSTDVADDNYLSNQQDEQSRKDGESPIQTKQSDQTEPAEPIADKSLEDVSDEEMANPDKSTEEIVILREDSSTTVLAKIDLTLDESDTEEKSSQATDTRDKSSKAADTQEKPSKATDKQDKSGKKADAQDAQKNTSWESEKRLLMTDSGFEIDMEVIDVGIEKKPKEKILYPRLNRETVKPSRKSSRAVSPSRNSDKSSEIPKVSSRRSDSTSRKKETHQRAEAYRLGPSREQGAERRDSYHYGRRRTPTPPSYREPLPPPPVRPPYYPPVPAQCPPSYRPPYPPFRPPYPGPDQQWKPSYETPHFAPYHADPSRPPNYPPRGPPVEPERPSSYHYDQPPAQYRPEGSRRERSQASPPWQSTHHSRGRKFQVPSSSSSTHRDKSRRSPPPKRHRSRSRSLSDMSEESDYVPPPSKKPDRSAPSGGRPSSVKAKRVSRSPISISSQSRSLSPVSGSPSPEKNLLRNEIVKSVKQFLHVAREIQHAKDSQKSLESESPPVRHVSASRRSPALRVSPSPKRRVIHNVNRHSPSSTQNRRQQSRSPPPSHRPRGPVQQKVRRSLGKRSRSPKRDHKSSYRHRSPSPVSSESSGGSPAPPPRGRYKDFQGAPPVSSRQSYGTSKPSREPQPSVSPGKGYERKVTGSTWSEQQKLKLASAEAQLKQQYQVPQPGPAYAPPSGSMYPYGGAPYPPSAPSSGGGHQSYPTYPSGVYQPNTSTGPYQHQQHYGSGASYPQQPPAFMPPTGYAPPPAQPNPQVAKAYEQAFSILSSALGELQQPQQQQQQQLQHQPAYQSHMTQAYASTSSQAGQSMPAQSKTWSMGSNSMVFQRVLGKEGTGSNVSRKNSGTIESISDNRGRHERPKVAKDVRILTSVPTRKK